MPSRSKQGFSLALPRLPQIGLPSVPELAGGPRRERLRLHPGVGYPPPPAWFVNSLAEWVVYWYLTEGRRPYCGRPNFRRIGPTQEPQPGSTFFYQIQVPNLGYFQSEVTRVDFLLPGLGDAGYTSLAIDPYNTYTHTNLLLDLFKRQTLGTQAHVQLIWILTDRLENGDLEVIEQALHGDDESPRALLGV